jgi:hypothetical protein
MSYRGMLGSALLLLTAIMPASNLQAARACSPIKEMQAINTSPAADQSAPRELLLEECASGCSASDSQGDSADAVAVPTHLPVVSSPDQIAAWHAEIFDRLQADDDLRYCSVTVQALKNL